MGILTKLMESLPLVLPALIAFNLCLSAVGGFLAAIHQNNAATIVGKIAGVLKKVIDMVQGNNAH
jgi:hypothetical protein